MSADWYYRLNGKCVFQVNAGGNPGTATLTFGFNYRFSNFAGAAIEPRTSEDGASFESALEITPSA